MILHGGQEQKATRNSETTRRQLGADDNGGGGGGGGGRGRGEGGEAIINHQRTLAMQDLPHLVLKMPSTEYVISVRCVVV